ncbi:MAG: T9SS C-terminal target domain-containing protein [Bacteroidetes bacterium]|nr:MAG: T9SS C-terminal target domain-containing protein [Bacteroidota bacterium]
MIMKKLFLLFLGMIISIGTVVAQEGSLKPIVTQATYFDISPPLRDMVQDTNATVDMSWKVGVAINPKNVYSNEVKVDIPFLEDPVRQSFFGQVLTDTTIQNYEGIGMSGWYPPDSDGDVGPDNYFQVVNLRFAIYDKNGVKLVGPSPNSSIFSGMPNNSNDGDAVVLYDENADRWLFSQFSLPHYPNGPFYENVAISQTSDPTGSWWRYQFTFSDMPDYPKLSVWGDAYYMTVRRFAAGSGNWLGPAVVAMNRTEMLAGNPASTMITFNLPSSSEGPLPADCDSDFPPDGTPCPVCYLISGSNASINLSEFHADWATPANSTFNLTDIIPISPFVAFGNSSAIPQKNTNQKLDAMSGKRIMFRMPFRKFDDHWSMLLNTTVKLTDGVAGIRWMEVRNTGSGWSLFQEGTYSPDDNYRWMGSIAMDSLGNIALGYSISSSTMYPSIRYTGRMSCDPLGLMTIEERGIINGGGSQTTYDGRWGDYSAMAADPVDIGKFWYTQEYYTVTSSASWRTRIASFSFAGVMCFSVTATPEQVCFGDSTHLEAFASGGSGTYTYSWGSIPPGFTSDLQDPWAIPTEDTKYYCEVSDGDQTRTDTAFVSVNGNPIVFAGNDTTLLNTTQIINLYGEASDYLSLLWTTSGDGSFWKDYVAETYYYPGSNDIATGGVTLTLTAAPIPTCTDTISDEMNIYFVPNVEVPEMGADRFHLFLVPNPTRGSVTMNLLGLGGLETTISITTIQGKYVHREVIGTGQNSVTSQVDLSGFPSGIYLVRVQSLLGTIVQKLVVE